MIAERIGFIGAGQMAIALARGAVAAGVASAEQLIAFDPMEGARRLFEQQIPGAHAISSHDDMVRGADLFVLAVKPQHVDGAAREWKGRLGDNLLISIVAGKTLTELSVLFGTRRLVRVMPNTPCLVGQGASAYSVDHGVRDGDAELVQTILDSVGISAAVPEGQLDAVTGLSGSGPAYVAVFIEALSDGGVRMGLPRALATRLAIQTVRGTAELLLRTGRHPAEIKDQVASPGGTTIAGLRALEDHAFRGAIISAVEAATRRATELGRDSATDARP